MSAKQEVTYVADDTTKSFAQSALDAQDACNFGALVKSLNEHLEKLRKSSKVLVGDEECKVIGNYQMKHPASVLFVNKLTSLCGDIWQGVDPFHKAFDACQKLVKGEDVTIEIELI